MKKILMKGLLAVGLGFCATQAALAADVGVSVSIGQPGFYGQIDIGNYPRPQVVYAEPVIIQRSPVVYQPVYLRVPPGHQKHWGKHCAEYGACGRPVYFVRDTWYEQVYVPQYRERHGGGGGPRGNYHGDDNDQGHDHGGGGHGNGKGHGKGGKGHGD